MSKTRLYVIGDREKGAIFITIDPLRAAYISSEDIGKYAQSQGSDFDETFGRMAAAVKKLIVELDDEKTANPEEVSSAVGTTVESGYSVSDAEFCFVADLVNVNWQSMRIPHPPLVNFLHHLGMGHDTVPPTTFDAKLKPSGGPDPEP